jgi:lambda family phage portal protein
VNVRAALRTLTSGIRNLGQRSYRILRATPFTERLLGGSVRTSSDTQWQWGARRVSYVARELVRNEPIAATVVELVAQRAIGRDGITLRADTGDRELDREIERVFAAWSKCATPQGQSLRALQHLWARECATVGEGFGYWLVDDKARFLIQPFEQEDLDILRGQYADPPEFSGVKFDEYGTPVAYRVARNRPGGLRDYTDWWHLDAYRVFHMRFADRPTASRGTSPFDSVATLIYQISRSTEAELDTLRASAHFGIHFKTEVPASDLAMDFDAAQSDVQINNDSSAPVFGTGGFANIGNYDAKMIACERPGGAYVPFLEVLTRQIAARFGVPWSALAGDYSKNSGMNGRLEEITTQGGCFGWQNIIIEQGLDKMLPHWLRWAVTTLRVDLRGMDFDEVLARCSWVTPAHAMLDPQREAMALQMELNMGVTSWGQACARYGKDPQDQLETIRKDNDAAAAEGVTIPLAGSGDIKQPEIPNISGEGGGENGPASVPQGNAVRSREARIRAVG